MASSFIIYSTIYYSKWEYTAAGTAQIKLFYILVLIR